MSNAKKGDNSEQQKNWEDQLNQISLALWTSCCSILSSIPGMACYMVWYGPARMVWYIVWPSKHVMVYGIASWASHVVWYGLADSHDI